MKRNKYLITGAGGFLGKIINRFLLSQGDEVISLNRGNADINIDISSPFKLPDQLGIDVVVHAAGKAHMVPKTEKEKETFYQVNFEGTQNLCRALSASFNLPKAFVFISTVAVYGVEEGAGITEEHPLNGTSPYAKSKILAEEWLKCWALKHGVSLAILRLPLIAGPNPPGNLGAMIRGIEKGYYFNIAGGESRKSIVLATDVAKIVPRAAEVGGIYNLTDGCHPSFVELSKKIAKNMGKRAPLNVPKFIIRPIALFGDILGRKAPINSDKLNKIVSTLTFNDTAAIVKLGWKPTAVLDDFEM